MREALGSIPRFSKLSLSLFFSSSFFCSMVRAIIDFEVTGSGSRYMFCFYNIGKSILAFQSCQRCLIFACLLVDMEPRIIDATVHVKLYSPNMAR